MWSVLAPIRMSNTGTKIARGAVVEVEEIETKDMKIVESTKPKRSRVRRGKGKRALDVEET